MPKIGLQIKTVATSLHGFKNMCPKLPMHVIGKDSPINRSTDNLASLECSPFPQNGLVHTVHACAGFSHSSAKRSVICQWVGMRFYDKLVHAKNSVYQALIWIMPGYEANNLASQSSLQPALSKTCEWFYCMAA